jgi:hypothetical protein
VRVGGRLAHGVVVAMIPVITSRRSEGPLGDVGSEKAEACVSARFAKGYYHAKKGPVAESLPKANRKPLADPGIGWGEAGRRWLTDGHVCFQPDR